MAFGAVGNMTNLATESDLKDLEFYHLQGGK